MYLHLDDKDAAIVVVGLLLVDIMLFKSRYSPELQEVISERAKQLIEEIHKARNGDNYHYESESSS